MANLYDIDPEKFKGKLPQPYTENSNEFIQRNTSKCILCGLCVRSCSEVMNISAVGLVGRGFKTDVSTPFSLPLNEVGCTNCGLCVELCPTGALTEKSALKKQVPLDEDYKLVSCDIDGKKCEFKLSFYNGKLLRAVPHDDNARHCNLSREEIFKKFADA